MSTGENYDYTAGEGVPESALNADDLVIGGSGAIDHDPNKTEAENYFYDLTPGHYLLKLIGFGDVKLKAKTGYINGQAVNYNAYQVEARFADANSPNGRIRNYFLLPPESPADLVAYNHGTNAGGKAEGFMSKIFDHFIDRLLPGEAYVIDQKTGAKRLSDKARSLANWKGRLVWAEVSAGKEDKEKFDPTTGDPYPARDQIKLFSFKPYVEGGPNPFGQAKATVKAPLHPRRDAELVAARAAHAPAAAMAAAGIDAI